MCGEVEEPSTSTFTQVSQEQEQEKEKEQEKEQEQEQDNDKNMTCSEPSDVNTSEKKAPPQDSPLVDDEENSPVPELTNGIEDSSD